MSKKENKPDTIKIVEIHVQEFLGSEKRNLMLTGERYYLNDSDIKEKTVLLENRANTKLEHAFVRKLVDQKIAYLLSKPLSVTSDDDTYNEVLNNIFDRSFLRVIKNVGKDAINKGIGWLQVYINKNGDLSFKRIPSEEIIPIWTDISHTELNAIIRVYEIEEYIDNEKETITKIEYWDTFGVKYFIYESGSINIDPDKEANSHFTINENPYNFNKIPFVAFKYNDEEQPILSLVKTLVDEYNYQASINADILRDLPNLIYILQDLGEEPVTEFIIKLKTYGVTSIPGDSSITTIRSEPNIQATERTLEELKKSIIKFGRGVDFDDLNLGNATGVGLKFRYSDLDMDCNIIETEFQASFEDLIWFVNVYSVIKGLGEFKDLDVNIVFNRDIIISESDTIENCMKSRGIISEHTIIENHPWAKDVLLEKERIEKEGKEEDEDDGYNIGGRYVKENK